MLLEERPLHRNAIHQRLQSQDIHVGGKDSLGTLSAYLSNDKRFITAGRGEWTLAKSPAMEPYRECVCDYLCLKQPPNGLCRYPAPVRLRP